MRNVREMRQVILTYRKIKSSGAGGNVREEQLSQHKRRLLKKATKQRVIYNCGTAKIAFLELVHIISLGTTYLNIIFPLSEKHCPQNRTEIVQACFGNLKTSKFLFLPKPNIKQRLHADPQLLK